MMTFQILRSLREKSGIKVNPSSMQVFKKNDLEYPLERSDDLHVDLSKTKKLLWERSGTIIGPLSMHISEISA